MANEIQKKTCHNCGRIIIDPNNISGFFPRCIKSGLEIAIPALTTTVVGLATTYGKPVLNSALELVKNHKK